VAADLCSHNLRFPLRTHATMAMSNGVTLEDLREAVRHLAPYVGYPTAAEALLSLAELEEQIAGRSVLDGQAAGPPALDGQAAGRPAPGELGDGARRRAPARPGRRESGMVAPVTRLPGDVRAGVRRLDTDFAGFLEQQFDERWGRPNLSLRERALCTIATDVLNGTLDASFRLHIDIALGNGADEQQVRAVLLLVAEFGIARAWRAYAALAEILDRRA
jgi:alkylhydroperoxidase/carboxymuconolactone decarboxylase family protein YurZ